MGFPQRGIPVDGIISFRERQSCRMADTGAGIAAGTAPGSPLQRVTPPPTLLRQPAAAPVFVCDCLRLVRYALSVGVPKESHLTKQEAT